MLRVLKKFFLEWVVQKRKNSKMFLWIFFNVDIQYDCRVRLSKSALALEIRKCFKIIRRACNFLECKKSFFSLASYQNNNLSFGAKPIVCDKLSCQ